MKYWQPRPSHQAALCTLRPRRYLSMWRHAQHRPATTSDSYHNLHQASLCKEPVCCQPSQQQHAQRMHTPPQHINSLHRDPQHHHTATISWKHLAHSSSTLPATSMPRWAGHSRTPRGRGWEGLTLTHAHSCSLPAAQHAGGRHGQLEDEDTDKLLSLPVAPLVCHSGLAAAQPTGRRRR